MYKAITKCRICGNTNLVSLLYLGDQSLTGVFPKHKTDKITSGPLELVKCHPKNKNEIVCHLVQLHHSYDRKEMYGLNYGYRSGLNQSMVNHLTDIVKHALSLIELKPDDLVIDIGSNDSTLLQQYPSDKRITLTGIDPTGVKFKKYYPSYINLITDFFSSDNINKAFPDKKAKVITSIAMFYDLEEPMSFVRQVGKVLADDGIWVFEQSYLPAMLETNSYDTICHEHLEYYALRQIKYMMDSCGFKIIDVEMNDINGGSFRVTAARSSTAFKVSANVSQCEMREQQQQLDSLNPYQQFSKDIEEHRKKLISLIKELQQQGKRILGYGASTKGNVVLQYCGLTSKEIPYIAEVNEDKFDSYTPFTHIPIISEKEARGMNPDYFLVLPWHFRKGIIEREKDFLKRGGKLIFPLPNIEIISNS